MSTSAKKVTVGLIQMSCSSDPAANLQKAVRGVEDVAGRGAQIICLPELFLTSYFCQGKKDDRYFDWAESVPGPTTVALGKIAKKTNTVILCPLFEKTDAGKFFNSIAVIGPDGKVIGVYHKMHIPSLPPDFYAEDYYFEKGDEGFKVFDTPYAKIGPMICYDQWFPEGARIAATKGAQILFYPTAIGWPVGPAAQREELNAAEHEAWQITQRSHGIDNNVFVVAVNRVGTEGDLKFWGTSFVSDPYGRVVAKAGTDREEHLVVTCDLSVIESMRKEWPFLEERQIRCEQAPKVSENR